MYIENFESFYQQAVDLYQNNPLQTRFVTKYRHCDGRLSLKVTDDSTVRRRGGHRSPESPPLHHRPRRRHRHPCFLVQCLQFKTDQQSDLKKIEKLNRMFFSLMATGAAPPAGAQRSV